MLSPSVSAHMEKTDSTRRLVRFGVFELDLRAGELRKNGLKIKLREQPFQILATLLERPGEIVTREELRQKLWSNNTFVDFDNSVNKAINKIREAVGTQPTIPALWKRWLDGGIASSLLWKKPVANWLLGSLRLPALETWILHS